MADDKLLQSHIGTSFSSLYIFLVRYARNINRGQVLPVSVYQYLGHIYDIFTSDRMHLQRKFRMI